jgi:hypothetical protein
MNEAIEYAAKREAIQRGMSICHTLVADTQEGKMNALDAFADLKAIIAAAQDAMKEVEPLAMEEAQKYPKTFEYHNLTFTRTEGRRMYKYDHIPEWKAVKATLTSIEQEAKDAADQQAKGNVIAGDDGVVKDAAIVTFTKSSLSVK